MEHMKQNVKKLAIASVATAICAASANASLTITDLNFTNVGGSGTPPTEGQRDVSQLIDGSGVTLNGLGQQIVEPSNPNGNQSNLLQQTGGLLIDLGSVQNVGALQIFNFNDQTGNSDFGPASFDFYFTSNLSAVSGAPGALQVADLSLFTQLADDQALQVNTVSGPVGGTVDALGETFTFGSISAADQATIGDQTGVVDQLSATSISARYLFLDDLNGTDSFSGRVGFAEIQVFGAVPEPSSTVLLGLGGLAFLLHRRK